MHSTVSDGTLSVSALVDAVHAASVSVFALTDHDCVDGMPEARARAGQLGIRHVTGVEISTRLERSELHILGYGFDPEHPTLVRALRSQREARTQRIPKIVARLNDLGIEVTVEDVLRIAGNAAIGRPHVARALVERGVCANLEDAFSRYLGDNAPAQVRKEVPTPSDAIEWIHAADGKAVWAHPLAKQLNRPGGFAQLARELKAVGLDGIEEMHPGHDPSARKRIRTAARELGLALTGGSDYHGGDPSMRLGMARGGEPIPESIVDSLQLQAS